MQVSGQLFFDIGAIYWAILFLSVFFGSLRNNVILTIHFVISSVMLYYGIKYLPLNLPCEGNENGAGFLFGPIVFVASYTALRFTYKKIFNVEPDMEAYSGYSSRDKRGLNFMDYLTFFIPFMLSAIVNLVLANYQW